MKRKRKPISVSDEQVIEIINNPKDYEFKPVENYTVKMETQGDIAEYSILYCLDNGILVKKL